MQGFQKQLKQPVGLKRVVTNCMNKKLLVPFLLGEQEGSGGILLQKILKFQSPTMRFPAFWRTEKSVFFSKENVAFI